MAREVIAIKLVSGEELLGKVLTEDDNMILMEDVLGLIPQNTPTGLQIGLGPFMMSNPEGNLEMQKNAIVTRTTPTDELEKGYTERTSKIDLTSKLPGM